MSRRSVYFRRLANSGPLVAVRTPPSNIDTMVRSVRSSSELNAILPSNMKDEKRKRIINQFTKR